MGELAAELTIELIPSGPEGRYRKMAEAIGAENFYKLCCAVGGTLTYIPLADSILRPVMKEQIKKEFTGKNHRELASKYGVTDRWVRELCRKKQPAEQLSICDTDIERRA